MKKVIYILAFIHLATIAIVIFHGIDKYVHGGWWEKPLAFLCSINYSIWQYGFFSPDVGKSTELEIKIHTDGGQIKNYSTLKGFEFYTSNAESLNRFYGYKHHTAGDSTFLDLCARSVAARMLNIHEDAGQIDYIMRSIRYPTMKEYEHGTAPRIVEFYSTTFILR